MDWQRGNGIDRPSSANRQPIISAMRDSSLNRGAAPVLRRRHHAKISWVTIVTIPSWSVTNNSVHSVVPDVRRRRIGRPARVLIRRRTDVGTVDGPHGVVEGDLALPWWNEEVVVVRRDVHR